MSEVTGTTPFEKADSLLKILNSDEKNNIAKVFFVDYIPKDKKWVYNVYITDGEFFQQGFLQADPVKAQALFAILRKVIVNTVKWDDTALGVVVTAKLPKPVPHPQIPFPVGGIMFSVNDAGMKGIRQYVGDDAEICKQYLIEEILLDVPRSSVN
jgi:hypothetical protein